MTLSFEVLLALGVVGFYLVDSAQLLFANELLFVHTRGRWSSTAPATGWQIVGRYLQLPNLLTPERALFRLCWSASATAQTEEKEDAALPQLLAAIDSLRYPLRLLWVLLLIAVPLALIVLGAGLTFLGLLGVVYATIVLLLVQIYRRRAVLLLSSRGFAKLAFDALACAPLALNLARKISLQHNLSRDPVGFARERFDRDSFAQLVERLSHWIGNELAYEEEASPRYRALRDYQQTLARMVS